MEPRRSAAFLSLLSLLALGVDGARLRSQQATSHPIQNIIKLLNDLEVKVEEQMADEEVTWAKFETWSKTSKKSLKKAIGKEEEKKASLEEAIAGEEASIDSLAQKIEKLNAKISQLDQEQAAAEEKREADHEQYKEDVKMYKQDIKAMDAAEAEIGKSASAAMASSASFVQRNIRRSMLPNAPPVEKVEHHTEGAVEVFEDLEHDFEDRLESANTNETNGVNSFKLAKNARKGESDAAKTQRDDCETEKGDTETSLGDNKADLAQVSSDLKNNQDSLAEVEADFRSQHQAYQMRRTAQTGEIEAIKQAVKIMEKVTHVDAPSFLQLTDPKSKVVDLLRTTARETKSVALQRLVKQISTMTGPFDKVSNTIQKMIFRLQNEQKEEDDHKNWCDQELEKTNTSRKESTETVESLEDKLDVLTSKIAQLTKTREEKEESIADFTANMKELTDMRAEDKKENTRIIKEAQEAQDAIAQATNVLTDYYKKSGAVSEEESFVQAPVVLGDKPGTWDSSYTGAADPKNPGKGILAILEKVNEDYSKVEADTKASETGDQNRYDEEMKNFKIRKAEAEAEVKQLGSRIGRKSDSHQATRAKKETRTEQLKGEEQYWDDLQKACVDGDSSYEERKESRQKEIDGLDQALNILRDAFKPKK